MGYTAPVGQFPPNAFGLYDMYGNVREWVEDPWHLTYRGTPPTDGSTWIEGGDPNRRILRGGSWINGPAGAALGRPPRSRKRLSVRRRGLQGRPDA